MAADEAAALIEQVDQVVRERLVLEVLHDSCRSTLTYLACTARFTVLYSSSTRTCRRGSF